jgi:hypothetical protein
MQSVCAKTQPFDGNSYNSCYTSAWPGWAKRLRTTTVAAQDRKQFNVFLAGGGARGLCHLVLGFPRRHPPSDLVSGR